MLRDHTAGKKIPVPEKVVIIGAGNVAMDIARTMARLQKQKYGEVHTTICARKDVSMFRAAKDEIEEAIEEGVEIIELRAPQEMMRHEKGRKAGHVSGLRTWKVIPGVDEKGRFAPTYEQDNVIIPADMIVEATGQQTDISLLGTDLTERLEWNRDAVKIDRMGRTSEPWLWAGGDAVNEGTDVISAVADGHRIAESVNEVLAAGRAPK